MNDHLARSQKRSYAGCSCGGGGRRRRRRRRTTSCDRHRDQCSTFDAKPPETTKRGANSDLRRVGPWRRGTYTRALERRRASGGADVRPMALSVRGSIDDDVGAVPGRLARKERGDTVSRGRSEELARLSRSQSPMASPPRAQPAVEAGELRRPWPPVEGVGVDVEGCRHRSPVPPPEGQQTQRSRRAHPPRRAPER